ncbi:MAG: site-specific integrase [Candidatus Sericytochromatia bacterium]|nr:site-specific integrase [Candidatus Sericytochromatia bacterium]
MTRFDLTPKPLLKRIPVVRVYTEGERVLVKWTQHGRRQYRTWADTTANRAEALAFARGLSDAQQAPARPTDALTVQQLFRRYLEAEAATLRPNTIRLYKDRWRRWELFVGADTIAEDVATETVARFRVEDAKHHAINQVRAAVRVVKLVYHWGDRMELLQRNRVARYTFKAGKDERTHAPTEYRRDEWERLLMALGGGQQSRKWRAWAVMMLAGAQGERVQAILQLRWADLDLEAGVIRWPKETNKQGRARTQPLTWDAYSALLTSRAKAPDSPYVVPGPDGEPYTYQAFWYHLRAAERATGVTHQPYRAAHGFRRMAAGNVAEGTGDPWLGVQWIGDTDPRRAKEYLKERADRMLQAADAASGER